MEKHLLGQRREEFVSIATATAMLSLEMNAGTSTSERNATYTTFRIANTTSNSPTSPI